MNQSVLVYADINEGTKGGDIGDNTFQFHTLLEVFHGHDVFAETDFLKLFTRVAARFFQFVDNIFQGQFTDLIADIGAELNLAYDFYIANQLFEWFPEVGCNFSTNLYRSG